jgi:hypothetical protein
LAGINPRLILTSLKPNKTIECFMLFSPNYLRAIKAMDEAAGFISIAISNSNKDG